MGRQQQNTETAGATVEQPSRAVAKFDKEKFRAQLMERLPDLLPAHTTPERFMAVTLQAIAKNPDLYDCEPTSILMSALEVAQVGLEPTGSIGGASLVPIREKNGLLKAQVIFDYRGLQHLIRQGGGGEVKAVVVYKQDEFAVYEGTNPRIEHIPSYESFDPEDITFVYAYPIRTPTKFEVMSKAQIDAIRALSRLRNGVPWTQHYAQMARKTVIRRLANYLDLRPDTRALIERDTEREFGTDQAPVVTVTRSARLRDRLMPAQDAPGAVEAVEADVSTPTASADQQTGENAGVEAETRSPEEIAAAAGTTWKAPDPALFREVRHG